MTTTSPPSTRRTAGPFPGRVYVGLLVAGVAAVAASVPYLSEQILANPTLRAAMPPVPLPVLQTMVVAQSAVYLAVIIPLGLWLAGRVGLQAPLLEAWAAGRRPAEAGPVLALGLGAGVIVGTAALALEMGLFFGRLPPALQALDAGPVALWKRLLVGFLYGGIVEELFFRLLLLSLLAWLLSRFLRQADGRPAPAAFWLANLGAAVLFALGHLPATSTIAPLSALLVVRALVLNGLVGLTCGYLFWRRGLEAAMLAHMGFHLVWQFPLVWLARAMIAPGG